MSEDLDKKAWEIFSKALDYIEFPEYVTVNKKEDGSFSFLLNLSNKSSGIGFFYYKPSIEVIKDILTDISEEKIKYFGNEFSQEIAYTFASAVAYLWLKNFHLQLAESFLDLPEIPLLAMTTAMQEVIDEHNEQRGISRQNWERNAHNSVKELIARKAQSIEARVYSESRNFLQFKAPRKNLIAYYYSTLHKRWKEAKNCYETNKKFNNWQKMVAAAFEELPAELIERLGDSDSYTASPSAIALEHAALICGIDVESVGLRTLQNYLKESRDWIEQVGEEKAREAAGKYLGYTLDQVIETYRVSYLLGKKPPMEKFTFLEKELLADGFEDKLILAFKKNEDERANSEKQGEV